MLNFEGTTQMKLYHTCANCFEDIHTVNNCDQDIDYYHKYTEYEYETYNVECLYNPAHDPNPEINWWRILIGCK